jgi:MFS family permease
LTNPTLQRVFAPFRERDFRFFFVALACQTLANRALVVVVGFTIYELTNSTLAIGYLGLIEAIPSIGLALYGGHVADRKERRSIMRVTLGLLTVSGAALAALTGYNSGHAGLVSVYAIMFVVGLARGFGEPAAAALEAQIVPRRLLIQSATLMSGCWMTSAILGPLLAGSTFGYLNNLGYSGAAWTMSWIAALYFVGWCMISQVGPRPLPKPKTEEPIWDSVVAGARYVWHDQVLLGSMALDLFAVLFGGAIALLPVFAKDILHVGPEELGILAAAPTTGALLTMVWSARSPPVKHAGRNFLWSVAGFGVVMIVFALSTNFYLSIAMLFLSGVFDGVSVVIRRSIMRLMSPDHLRGRIASVSMIFIGSSNELGALESGLAAAWLGTERSVWMGGCVTLLVVAAAYVLAPKLRTLSLDPNRAATTELPTPTESELPPKSH